MKFQIKKRFSNEILIEGEANSFKEFVEANKADLSEADLSNANLSETDLSNADLYKADLSNANLSEADLSNADLSEADLYKAKIKITQKDEIIKALKIEIIT